MNVTFKMLNEDFLDSFLEQAEANSLYALKGHRDVGGIRASIYNAMPMAGCEALVNFMQEFEKSNA
jgi:phosphoserine aminotransferase